MDAKREMTREEAARWLAERICTWTDMWNERLVIERALLDLTAREREANCPMCGWPGPNVVGHCLHHDKLATPSVLARGEVSSGDACNDASPAVAATPGQTGSGSLTVAGALDMAAAAVVKRNSGTVRAIVNAATRNLKPVKVPTREELDDHVKTAQTAAQNVLLAVDRHGPKSDEARDAAREMEESRAAVLALMGVE